jgi:hypothetical protein
VAKVVSGKDSFPAYIHIHAGAVWIGGFYLVFLAVIDRGEGVAERVGYAGDIAAFAVLVLQDTAIGIYLNAVVKSICLY